MKVEYIGHHDEVEIYPPEGGYHLVRNADSNDGEPVEVSKEFGASLLEQKNNWRPADQEAQLVSDAIAARLHASEDELAAADAAAAAEAEENHHKLLATATRPELEAHALAIGLDNPDSFQNKGELLAAIESHEEAAKEQAADNQEPADDDESAALAKEEA